MQLTCVYDHRPAHQPRGAGGARGRPHTLRWGEGTDDEMCLNSLYVTL